MTGSNDQIAAERRVVTAMYRALDQTEPRLRVSKHVVEQAERLLTYILDEEPVSEYFGLWPLVFEGVRWSDQAAPDDPHCGYQLLRFIGTLGEVFRYEDEVVVPRVAGIRLLLEFDGPWVNWLRYRERGGRWELATTTSGAAALGGPACFRLKEWPERSYSTPGEQFERLLQPHIMQI